MRVSSDLGRNYQMCSGYIVRHGWRALSLLSLSVITLTGCVYDSEHRCGPHQVLKMGNVEYCACDEYSVSTASGCAPCGTNEVVGPSGCQCASGYAKSSADGPCTPGADSGSPGDSGTLTDAGVGAPKGLGKPCSSSSDCAGTEATFCDLVVTRSCVVEGCSLAANDCFTGYACCDLSKYGLAKTICALGQCQ